jgi:hypothetical protein
MEWIVEHADTPASNVSFQTHALRVKANLARDVDGII